MGSRKHEDRNSEQERDRRKRGRQEKWIKFWRERGREEKQAADYVPAAGRQIDRNLLGTPPLAPTIDNCVLLWCGSSSAVDNDDDRLEVVQPKYRKTPAVPAVSNHKKKEATDGDKQISINKSIPLGLSHSLFSADQLQQQQSGDHSLISNIVASCILLIRGDSVQLISLLISKFAPD
ncbi:hypothetical protein niasHT_040066 [Heterodera trifolii]|uniref:Uncharacterized protein n=1 Tax=Heterodera trifolii TaxID=157864 RepID=A0ABD2J2E0_9BILA